ncbi:acetyltransferase [Alphaproteobacteria bacterium]|nr:acetyltransferase [Alphaproteobacteria bacterium]
MNMVKLKNKKIIMLGAGGHARVLYDIISINQVEICAVVDITEELLKPFNSFIHINNDENIEKRLPPEKYEVINAVGMIPGKKIFLRKSLYSFYKLRKYDFVSLIHPSAIISKSSKIYEGVNIMAGCIIQANTRIYENTIINTGVKIDHDCTIGKNVHISPGTTLCGNVKVGDNSFIGAGVIGLPGTVIPSESVIPAGKVLKNNNFYSLENFVG